MLPFVGVEAPGRAPSPAARRWQAFRRASVAHAVTYPPRTGAVRRRVAPGTAANHSPGPDQVRTRPDRGAGRSAREVDQLVEHPGEGPDARSRSCRRSIHSFGAWALSSGGVKPRSTTGRPRTRSKAGADRDRAALADVDRRPRRRSPRAPGPRPASPGGRSASGSGGRRRGSVTVGRHAGRGDRLDVGRGTASKIRSGSWAATSRQLTLAWAWAGMIVLLPSPWKPPHMPLTSSVGRAAAALERRVAGLADERRQPELGAVGRLVERQRGEAPPGRPRVERHDVVVEARDRGSGRRGP